MQTPLLLLHGAIGASDQLQPLADKLSGNHDVCLLDFPGHGGKEDTGDFSIQDFAAFTGQFIEEKGWSRVNIFGYSMGGYVGMYLAKQHPERVGKIITLATKFNWDEAIAASEIKMLNADKISEKLPAFAETLQKRHAPNDWKTVLSKSAEMLTGLGKENALKLEDYKDLNTPSLILLGDRDKMVTLDETVAVYRQLPNAQMGILPGTPHPIEQVDPELLAYFINRFLKP